MTLSRRLFIKRTLAFVGASASFRIGFWNRHASAEAAGERRRLVVVIMRGAVDALGLLAPVGDPAYPDMRTTLAFPRDRLLSLDEFYGLTPAFEPIHPWFKDGDLLLVPAVSSQYRDRSHFDGQSILESGLDDPTKVSSGWLGRIMKARGEGLTAATLSGGVPTILLGAPRIVNLPPPDVKVPGIDIVERLAKIYEHDPAFASFADEIREAGRIGSVQVYGHPLIRAFNSVAEILARRDGPSIAIVNAGGWDTHSNQGTVDGRMFTAANVLANGLKQLRETLGTSAWRQTVVLGISEFGRTVRVNGSGGTDHGTGGFAFLAGGRVNGGQVYGEWPGLAERALYQNRDLMPVTDVRSLIKGVLADFLQTAAKEIEETAFPDSRNVVAAKDLFKA